MRISEDEIAHDLAIEALDNIGDIRYTDPMLANECLIKIKKVIKEAMVLAHAREKNKILNKLAEQDGIGSIKEAMSVVRKIR